MKVWASAEAEFESWWQGKLNFCYRFEDARAVMGNLQTRKVFVQGRPSDYLVTSNGVTFFAEVKSCAEPASFPLSNIKKSQWNCAIQQVAAKGQYWFYIRKEPERQWHKVPAVFFVTLFNEGVKSVKWVDLESFKWNSPT